MPGVSQSVLESKTVDVRRERKSQNRPPLLPPEFAMSMPALHTMPFLAENEAIPRVFPKLLKNVT